MKKITRAISPIICAIFSPTCALATYLKLNKIGDKAKANFIRCWSKAFFAVAFVTWVVCEFTTIGAATSVTRRNMLLWIYLWVLPFSRVNEIFLAFLKDSRDRFKQERRPEMPLNAYDRIVLVLRSYVEITINFAIIYYLGFRDCGFTHPIQSAVQSLYFSAITITTLGYGDLAPSQQASQILVVYEVINGLMLTLIALAVYLKDDSNGGSLAE
jgi:hypothetical protein